MTKHKASKKNVTVQIKDMKPNPNNPRKDYNTGELEELENSMESMGQLHPCILDENQIILAGHRRHHVANKLGWKTLNCNIKAGLSPFQKSAVLVSSNATQVGFNAWENREAISKIYWDEFLEEYTPVNNKDKGYSTFSRQMGISVPYVKKIVESTEKENKKYYTALKKAGASSDTVDTVMTAPKHLRGHLTEKALDRLKHYKKNPTKSKSYVRDYVRAEKRKAQIQEEDVIGTPKFNLWISRIEAIGYELTIDIIKKGDFKNLQKLQTSIEKNIIPFYNKLKKAKK